MSSLKNINLNDLVKNSDKSSLVDDTIIPISNLESKFSLPKRKMLPFMGERQASADNFYSIEQERHKPENYSKKMNHSTKINWLDYLNNIEKSKNKPVAEYIDKQIEWEKNLEPEEFTPPAKQAGEIIPLTFRKFFFHSITGDITQIALKTPKKLPTLIEEAQYKIQKNSLVFTDFIFDKQISAAICQVDNYSSNAKTYKKSTELQKIEAVIQWIIDTNLKMRYESSEWNKDGRKTASKAKDLLLICDVSLYQQIEIARHKEYYIEESRDYKEVRKLPLPLNEVWSHFREVITMPLKNNFQFIIIDKRALVSWHKLEKLEVKYDETNSLTYFLRKVHGGFKLLLYYNACAFISE